MKWNGSEWIKNKGKIMKRNDIKTTMENILYSLVFTNCVLVTILGLIVFAVLNK